MTKQIGGQMGCLLGMVISKVRYSLAVSTLD